MKEYVIIYKYTDNSDAGIVAVTHSEEVRDYLLDILRNHGDKSKKFPYIEIDNPEIIINR